MHSMTGFGSAEHATSIIVARVEAASVNRKQGEVVVQTTPPLRRAGSRHPQSRDAETLTWPSVHQHSSGKSRREH